MTMRILLFILALATGLHAHHEPGVTISKLDEQIALTPGLAELYYQRGVEYLAINALEQARTDFDHALSLKEHYLPAQRLLATVDFQTGKVQAALDLLRTSLVAVPKEHAFLLPGCHQLEGEILLSLKQPAAALTALEQALDTPFPELYTWQLRAEAQRALGQTAESIAGLKSAWEKSHAIILRNAWLDALLEADQTAEALPIIEAELSSSRFHSSWLIRRARATRRTNPKASTADLEAAIAELSTRLDVDPPPATLLADRGLAFALLGQRPQAEADLAQARTLGATPANLRLLIKTLSK